VEKIKAKKTKWVLELRRKSYISEEKLNSNSFGKNPHDSDWAFVVLGKIGILIFRIRQFSNNANKKRPSCLGR